MRHCETSLENDSFLSNDSWNKTSLNILVLRYEKFLLVPRGTFWFLMVPNGTIDPSLVHFRNLFRYSFPLCYCKKVTVTNVTVKYESFIMS